MAMFAIVLMAFTGCTVNEEKAVPLNDLDLAVEEVFAEDIMEDVMTESYDILFDAFEYGILKSDEEAEGPKCRTKTIEYPEGEPWRNRQTWRNTSSRNSWRRSRALKVERPSSYPCIYRPANAFPMLPAI